jgi:hypothetical protein
MNIIGSKYPLICLEENGLLLKWEIHEWNISLYTIDGKKGKFHAFNNKTNIEKILDLQDKEDWSFLEMFLFCRIEKDILKTLRDIPTSFTTKDGTKIKVKK